MTPDDFDRLQPLLGSRAGFALTRDRMQMAEHRLGPIARREGYHNVEALLAHVWGRPLGTLGWQIIETLLNAETWFRRDRQVFNLLSRDLLPALRTSRGNRPVRIWCAGGSSGQEAYSLAMAALETGTSVEILSTDLSSQALERGRAGIYTGFEIQRGLAARTMLEWFEPLEDRWQTRQPLRDLVRFERANLLDPLPESVGGAKPFDIIFCRYVLDDVLKDRRALILDHLCERLSDSGCLFLGLNERLEGKAFRAVAGQSGLFVKSPERACRAA